MPYLIFLLFQIPQASAELWASKVEVVLLENCDKKNHQNWNENYQKLAVDYVKEGKAEKESEAMSEILFPHLLPDSTPMRGVLLVCFESLKAYRNAKNTMEIKTKKGELISCLSVDRGDLENPIRLKLVDCLNKLKN